VILVNSNPATIMTDPEIADATYVEPITRSSSRRSSQGAAGRTAAHPGRPDRAEHANLPARQRALAKYGVELIGAKSSINKGEDRNLFKGVSRPSRRRSVTATPPVR